MTETSEGFWREVQRFIQAEIARAHKTQAVSPNVPYGSVVMDAFGHVVHAAAAAGGSGASFYLAGMSEYQFTTFDTVVMSLGGTTNSSGSGLTRWPATGTRHGIKPSDLGIYVIVAQMVWEQVGASSRRRLLIGQEDDDEGSYVKLAATSTWYDSTSLKLYQNVTYLCNHADSDTHYVAVADNGYAGSIKAAPAGSSDLSAGNWLSMLGPL